MRRLSLVLLVAVLGLSACGASTDDVADTTAATVETTTTTAPETTTTTAPETTTTVLETTTTTQAVDATNSPIGELEAFRWTFLTEFSDGAEGGLSVMTDGTYVGGDFDCAITAGLGGLEFTYGLVVVGGTAYVDDGTGVGYVEAPLDDARVTDSLGICPGSTLFWADITGGDPLPEGGEVEERNGIQARRLDLTGILSEASGLGLFPNEVEGVDFEELVFWVATDGDWITSVSMSGTLDPDAFAELTGSEVTTPGTLLVTLDVTDADDPDLVVVAPQS